MITVEKESGGIKWWEVILVIFIVAVFVGVIVYQVVPGFKVFVQKFANDVYRFTTIPR